MKNLDKITGELKRHLSEITYEEGRTLRGYYQVAAFELPWVGRKSGMKDSTTKAVLEFLRERGFTSVEKRHDAIRFVWSRHGETITEAEDTLRKLVVDMGFPSPCEIECSEYPTRSIYSQTMVWENPFFDNDNKKAEDEIEL